MSVTNVSVAPVMLLDEVRQEDSFLKPAIQGTDKEALAGYAVSLVQKNYRVRRIRWFS